MPAGSPSLELPSRLGRKLTPLYSHLYSHGRTGSSARALATAGLRLWNPPGQAEYLPQTRLPAAIGYTRSEQGT